MIGALLKKLGRDEEAIEVLETYRQSIERDLWTGNAEGAGFSRFAVNAFLGEADMALESLEKAIEKGWIVNWAFLGMGSFDEDFENVISDPRLEAAYSVLDFRATQRRESFRDNQGIPDRYRLE